MSMTITNLALSLCSATIKKETETLETILHQIIECNSYYIVAAKTTTKSAWEQKVFDPYITDSQELVVFLQNEDAIRFAEKNEIMSDETPMTIGARKDRLCDLIVKYSDEKILQKVKLYASPPIYISCSVNQFLGNTPNTTEKECTSGGDMAEQSELNSQKKKYFLGVDIVKKALDEFDPSKRRALDPSLRCDNVHMMIHFIISENKLDFSQLDSELDLPGGTMKSFCLDLTKCNTPIKTLLKILTYFGMEQYLYAYQNDCTELLSSIKSHNIIDKHHLMQCRGAVPERFILTSINRGSATICEETSVLHKKPFIYELTLESDQREKPMKIIVSAPVSGLSSQKTGAIIGNEYRISDVEPIRDDSTKANETEAADVRKISEDDKAEIKREKDKARLIVPERLGGNSYPDGFTDEEKLEVQDYIIGNFKKYDNDTLEKATERYKMLLKDVGVLLIYYHALKGEKEYVGYKRLVKPPISYHVLVKQLGYEPYAACEILIDLLFDNDRRDNIMQELKTKLAEAKKKNQNV